MSFTDRKPFVATEAQTKLRWGGRSDNFTCKLCGHKFKDGDTVRWLYANGTPGLSCGNFFACSLCDQGDEKTLEAAKESYATAVRLAKQWGIYGPDWQQDCLNSLRDSDR